MVDQDATHWDRLKQHGAYEPAELVVAVSQLRSVLGELEKIVSAKPRVIEEDPLLALALVKIDGLEKEFASEVAEANDKQDEKSRAQRQPYQPVDILLEKLHAAFRNDYQFSPTVGKNRTLAQVGDLHNIGVGNDGLPLPYHATSETPGLDPRRAFPGAGVQVGVADTALIESEWIAGAYQAAPYDRASAEPPKFTEGHAGFVSGLILQQAPGCTVVARRVLDPDGQTTAWALAKELVSFAHSGISVLNLSLGCFTDDDEAPLALATALDRIGPEVVVVAAAGNYNEATANAAGTVRPMWPAALEEVIAVGAVDRQGQRCQWSPPLSTPWLDAVAVGDGVVSSYVKGEIQIPSRDTTVDNSLRQPPWTADKLGRETFPTALAQWSGTSFSAATVSGAIAARTVPGVYSARAAWDALRRESEEDESSGVRLIKATPLLAAPQP